MTFKTLSVGLTQGSVPESHILVRALWYVWVEAAWVVGSALARELLLLFRTHCILCRFFPACIKLGISSAGSICCTLFTQCFPSLRVCVSDRSSLCGSVRPRPGQSYGHCLPSLPLFPVSRCVIGSPVFPHYWLVIDPVSWPGGQRCSRGMTSGCRFCLAPVAMLRPCHIHDGKYF